MKTRRKGKKIYILVLSTFRNITVHLLLAVYHFFTYSIIEKDTNHRNDWEKKERKSFSGYYFWSPSNAFRNSRKPRFFKEPNLSVDFEGEKESQRRTVSTATADSDSSNDASWFPASEVVSHMVSGPTCVELRGAGNHTSCTSGVAGNTDSELGFAGWSPLRRRRRYATPRRAATRRLKPRFLLLRCCAAATLPWPFTATLCGRPYRYGFSFPPPLCRYPYPIPLLNHCLYCRYRYPLPLLLANTITATPFTGIAVSLSLVLSSATACSYIPPPTTATIYNVSFKRKTIISTINQPWLPCSSATMNCTLIYVRVCVKNLIHSLSSFWYIMSTIHNAYINICNYRPIHQATIILNFLHFHPITPTPKSRQLQSNYLNFFPLSPHSIMQPQKCHPVHPIFLLSFNHSLP